MAFKQRFIYSPTHASYSHTPIEGSYRRVQLDGGAGRYRRDIITRTKIVIARWLLDPAGYNYIMAFTARFAARPEPFEIELIIEDEMLRLCDAWFIPDTFTVESKQGDIYTVSAQLEVLPPARDTDLDDYILSIISYFGADWPVWLDELHRIVNIELPAAMPYPPVPFMEP